MRILKTFSIEELCNTNGGDTALKLNTVRKYVWGLKKAGYIKTLDADKFFLLKNTGRTAPNFKKANKRTSFIQDNNLKKEVTIVKELLEERPKTNRVNIIKTFQDHKEFSIANIMEALGYTYSVAQRELFKLQKQNKVVFVRKIQGNNGKQGGQGLINMYQVKIEGEQ